FIGDLRVIVDDRIVYDRSWLEIVDNRRVVDIPDPDGRIRRYRVESGLGHDHRGLGKGQAPTADTERGHGTHCPNPSPPHSVRIADFGWGQPDPANVNVAVYPGNPARIPRRAEPRTDSHAHRSDRGRPVP